MSAPRRDDELRGGPVGGALWSSPEAEVDVTVVVPFYNPGPRLKEHVERVATVLSGTGATYEVIAVSDGSTDGSAESLQGVDLPPGVRVEVLPANRGKGAALRVGLEAGRGRYLGFIDADGDVPAELLASFVDRARDDGPDVVLGSKRHAASAVVYPPLRHLYSWGYQQLLRLLFDLSVADTQTGIKLVRRDVLRACMPLMRESGYAFDLELFVVANHLGYQAFLELPVRIVQRFASTISVRAVAAILRDTLAIAWRLRVAHLYDGDGAPRPYA
ncbi:MAG: glycosyltransferase family 2 protein [Acidimicrobiales bacterium]